MPHIAIVTDFDTVGTGMQGFEHDSSWQEGQFWAGSTVLGTWLPVS